MIAIIGTGSMGSAIAEGLLAAGREVIVYNRTRAKTSGLESAGAVVADSVASALRRSQAAIVVLPDASSTRDLLLAPETVSALDGARVLNVAYTTADEINGLAVDLRQKGARLAEVNVSSYPEPVRNRDGHFNLATDDEDREFWTDILRDLGEHVHFVGPLGNASHAEFALWLSYAFNPIAVAYSAVAFQVLGLPQEALVSALTENPTLCIAGAEHYLSQMASRVYDQGTFSVDNFAGSLDLMMASAAELGIPVAPFAAVAGLFRSASAAGYGATDVAGVFEAVAPKVE